MPLQCQSCLSAIDVSSTPTHNPHLVCAVHPSGVAGDRCIDFRLDPTAEPEEQWEPVGASYYNGKLIMQPAQRWSQLQQLEPLDWHPLFTGRCPECERAIVQVEPHQVHWDCAACGWMTQFRGEAIANKEHGAAPLRISESNVVYEYFSVSQK